MTSHNAPRIGLALGAGGARGLAHLVLLEVLDELGLKPAAIAGSSMGAVIGAPYAWGVSGRDLRAHAMAMTRDKSGAMARALEARVGAAGWLSGPILVDAEKFLSLFWPAGWPERIEEMAIPFAATATDYYRRAPVLFASGPLLPAVAGSMAIPGLIKAVEHQGRALVDGALVDPVPYESLFKACDVVIACDVIGGPTPGEASAPDRVAALFGATQILQHSVLNEKLSRRPPHLLLRPQVDRFKALDFFSAARIVRSVEAEREEMKRAIERALSAWTKKNP
jgi:NTE family protein